MIKKYFFITACTLLAELTFAQEAQKTEDHSVARQWNEVLLSAIRQDFARPTVHARNLFHVSAAMYDSWAVYDGVATPYLLGKELNGYISTFDGLPNYSETTDEAQKITISYAAYNLIIHRFSFSPGTQEIFDEATDLMESLGHDPNYTSTNISEGPAALGNYIANEYISYGLQDGSNESSDYLNEFYRPVNPPLVPTDPGNESIINLDRWQPLFIENFIDQSGNEIPVGLLDFLSPEWGKVHAFALSRGDLTINERDGNEYWVYHDPGPPPSINSEEMADEYKWGFAMVSVWGSHLDPNDGRMIDISPGNFGNLNLDQYPTAFENYDDFYHLIEGGDISEGHAINPATNEPYKPNVVPYGDYARVLAEFWADGPDSETPPGHWFTILNYVRDHPESTLKFEGTTDLSALEYDIKAYFTLGGAMHDAAVTAWGIKGWYDYIRPISAIRGMAEFGQSTDESASNYHENGLPLIEGYIETVTAGDPLAGAEGEHIGKIKLYTWRGHDFIEDTETDVAEVGWILAENWWPYQRPSFVTPPFAGYVSGHSTYSRAAAEVMTLITGDRFFPGGKGVFLAGQNEFLVFEEGPSVDIHLEWATYQDASEQTSLSRIWGGIHPPADDIPGRLIGYEIGHDAFAHANQYFSGITPLGVNPLPERNVKIYPNPTIENEAITIESTDGFQQLVLIDLQGKLVRQYSLAPISKQEVKLDVQKGMYFYLLTGGEKVVSGKIVVK